MHSLPHIIGEATLREGTDRSRAERAVLAAADAGCDEIRLHQVRRSRLYAAGAEQLRPEVRDQRITELPEALHPQLAQLAATHGLRYCVTPHYWKAIAVLEPWVDCFSVSSYQILWLDFLRELAATQKPVRMAVGMAEMDEILRAVETLRSGGCSDLTLMHTVQAYPTPASAANLAAITTLRRRLDVPVGWSDHTGCEDVVTRAVRAWGASELELVLDPDGTSIERRDGYAWSIGRTRQLKERLAGPGSLRKEAACDGDGVKRAHPAERAERDWRSDPADGLRPVQHLRADLRVCERQPKLTGAV